MIKVKLTQFLLRSERAVPLIFWVQERRRVHLLPLFYDRPTKFKET